jgi:BirA family biotin operon repressor/biotin-[acetyl-CoA-carboxylase] ligase
MPLDIQLIRQNLTTNWLAHNLYYEPVVGSTNELLKDLARQGEAAGTLFLTDFQSRGKGRHGRKWRAPADSSLLMSILFRPVWPVNQANWISMLAALAAIKAISEATGLEPMLKWPNDIVIGRTAELRKIGGILLESEIGSDRLEWIILGMGLNINTPAHQVAGTAFPATSLSIELGKNLPRHNLLLQFLIELERLYEEADRGWSPLSAWNKRLATLGKAVQVTKLGSQSILEGIAEATNEWGHLLVRDKDGILHTISAGDVTLSG